MCTVRSHQRSLNTKAMKCTLPSYPFLQCNRCHALLYPTEHCNCPVTQPQCRKCGANSHMTSNHITKCNCKHGSPNCNCLPCCFNCAKARKPMNQCTGHYAYDATCPLKKHMQCLSASPPTLTPSAQPSTL